MANIITPKELEDLIHAPIDQTRNYLDAELAVLEAVQS